MNHDANSGHPGKSPFVAAGPACQHFLQNVIFLEEKDLHFHIQDGGSPIEHLGYSAFRAALEINMKGLHLARSPVTSLADLSRVLSGLGCTDEQITPPKPSVGWMRQTISSVLKQEHNDMLIHPQEENSHLFYKASLAAFELGEAVKLDGKKLSSEAELKNQLSDLAKSLENQPLNMIIAGRNSMGEPDLVFVRLQVTAEQVEAGDHYDLASSWAAEQGYEGPFVSFDPTDPGGATMQAHFNWETASVIDCRIPQIKHDGISI